MALYVTRSVKSRGAVGVRTMLTIEFIPKIWEVRMALDLGSDCTCEHSEPEEDRNMPRLKIDEELGCCRCR